MKVKLLYVFKCPVGAPDCKIGITSNPVVRLGTYQNAFSRNAKIACFDYVYVGPPTAIQRLEKAIKDQFDCDIQRDGPGVTEWIADKTPEFLAAEIDKLIDGYKFKIVKVKPKFLPLSSENMDQFFAEYVKE